jgi:hypothetical protein
MTTLFKMAEQIQRMLVGGNPTDDTEWDLREIALYIEQLASKYMKQAVYDNIQLGEFMMQPNGSLLSVFKNVVPQYDEDRDKYYIEIPSSYIHLPGGRGLHSIAPMKDEYNHAIPVRGIYDTSCLKSNTSSHLYIVEGSTATFINSVSIDCPFVVKYYAASSGDVNDYDRPVNVPPEYESQMVQEAFQFFANRMPSDDVNDQNQKP